MNRLVAIALAALAAWPASAERLPQAARALVSGGGVEPIPAWIEFCADPEYARECMVDVKATRSIVLTKRTWSLILHVNRSVNESVMALADQVHWGREDVWDLAEDGKGDCEDLQMRKRRLLAAYGIPRRAMRMAAVALGDGTGHAVLTIATDRGDVVLDNRTASVLPWSATGYVFLKRESQDGPGWVSLEGNTTAPIATPAWVVAIRR